MANEEEEAAAPSADDRISSLPDDVLAAILSLLPLNESMRASILCSRWRHLWTLASIDVHMDGDFDRHPFRGSRPIFTKRLFSRLDALITIIARHRGPIRSFRLAPALWNHLLGCNQFVEAFLSWVQTLVHGGIRDLTLCRELPRELLTCESILSLDLEDWNLSRKTLVLPPKLKELKLGWGLGFWPEPELPPAVFDCQSLRSLELRRFDFDQPLDEPSPPNLRELNLQLADMTGDALSNVLSGFPFLDILHLHDCSYFSELSVSSSSLRRLVLTNICVMAGMSLVVKHVPNLEMLLLEKDARDRIHLKVLSAPKLRVLGCANVDMLEIGGRCFLNGGVTNYAACLHSVRTLALEVELREAGQVEALAGSLICFPCLEDLYVMFDLHHYSGLGDEKYWKEECSSGCLGRYLRMVDLKRFRRTPGHLCLARHFVRSCPLLKVISLLPDYIVSKSVEEAIRRELALNKRASPDLQVIFEADRDGRYEFSTLNYLS